MFSYCAFVLVLRRRFRTLSLDNHYGRCKMGKRKANFYLERTSEELETLKTLMWIDLQWTFPITNFLRYRALRF